MKCLPMAVVVFVLSSHNISEMSLELFKGAYVTAALLGLAAYSTAAITAIARNVTRVCCRCELLQKVCDLILSEDLDEAEADSLAGALALLLDFSAQETQLPQDITRE